MVKKRKFMDTVREGVEDFHKQEGNMLITIVPVEQLGECDEFQKGAILKWTRDIELALKEGYAPGCICCDEVIEQGYVRAWIIIGPEAGTNLLAVVCPSCFDEGVDKLLAHIMRSLELCECKDSKAITYLH